MTVRDARHPNGLRLAAGYLSLALTYARELLRPAGRDGAAARDRAAGAG
jgi:hypothetical protein